MARELRGRRLGMDTLIASATLLAWGASLVETIRGGVHVWYDAAVMFVFFLLVARMLEQRARNIASAQVDARSEEHTSELQSLMRISYAVFCLKKKTYKHHNKTTIHIHLHM